MSALANYKIKDCTVCGESFEPGGPAAKFCSDACRGDKPRPAFDLSLADPPDLRPGSTAQLIASMTSHYSVEEVRARGMLAEMRAEKIIEHDAETDLWSLTDAWSDLDGLEL
jgi:hypothetical protein